MKLSQDDAILFCENLGGSSLTFKTTRKDFIDDAVNDDDDVNDELMTFNQNREELAAFAAWFSAKEKGCRHIWTPFSDRDHEGEGTRQSIALTHCCQGRGKIFKTG